MTNGKLTPAELATVNGTVVAAGVAADLQHLADAYQAQFGKPLRPGDGYRTYTHQEEVFRDHYQLTPIKGGPTKTWAGRTWYQKPNKSIAALPGTSKHGLGLAIDFRAADVSPASTRAWLETHGFGWYWPAWARKAETYEPWHYEHAAPAAETGDIMAALPRLNWTKTTKGADPWTRTVQGLLQARGHYLRGRIDGIRGDRSIAALASFQVATNSGNGRGGADKIIAAKTWESLLTGRKW